jgi:exopolysaccharide biosynthesis polyprenyl glycosylphosphotransferase
MKRSEFLLMILQVPLDFLLLLLAGVSAYYLRFTDWAIGIKPVLFGLSLVEFLEVVAPVALAWIIIFAFAGLYSTDPNRKLMSDLNRVVFACTTGLAVVALYIMFTAELFDSRFLAAATWVFSIVYVIIGRILIRGLKNLMFRRGIGTRKVMIIGRHTTADEIAKTMKENKGLGYTVLGQHVYFNNDAKRDIEKKKPDEVILTNPRLHEEETLEAIEFCNDHHITFKYSADLFDTFSTNMSVHPLAGIPIVELKRTPLEGWGRVVKRVFDLLVGLIILIMVSPFLLITAIVILLETGRPIIYKNKRVGFRGQHFFAYKFRSMYKKDCTGEQFGRQGVHAQKKEEELIKQKNTRLGPIYKIKDDPRVTTFGRFMRRWSIDELPQFFNVLIGDMSIVGPRPHQPREIESEKEHKHVLVIKPGITGLAQISGRSDLSFEEEVRLDVFYIEKWRLVLDCIIFVKTPFVVVRKRKAL